MRPVRGLDRQQLPVYLIPSAAIARENIRSMSEQSQFMKEAIELARENAGSGGGGPFGAVVVRDGEVIARAANQVTATNDPTAHAEVRAIRAACERLGTFQLDGCELYTSCEPCPMCLGAIYWARLDRIYYACTQSDAAAIGFDDQFIYEEIDRAPEARKLPMVPMMRDEGRDAFRAWEEFEDRLEY